MKRKTRWSIVGACVGLALLWWASSLTVALGVFVLAAALAKLADVRREPNAFHVSISFEAHCLDIVRAGYPALSANSDGDVFQFVEEAIVQNKTLKVARSKSLWNKRPASFYFDMFFDPQTGMRQIWSHSAKCYVSEIEVYDDMWAEEAHSLDIVRCNLTWGEISEPYKPLYVKITPFMCTISTNSLHPVAEERLSAVYLLVELLREWEALCVAGKSLPLRKLKAMGKGLKAAFEKAGAQYEAHERSYDPDAQADDAPKGLAVLWAGTDEQIASVGRTALGCCSFSDIVHYLRMKYCTVGVCVRVFDPKEDPL